MMYTRRKESIYIYIFVHSVQCKKVANEWPGKHKKKKLADMQYKMAAKNPDELK